MTRTVSEGFKAALTAPEVEVYFAVELLFDSGAVRLWSGYGPRVIDGETYTGGGNLLSISGLDEVRDLEAKSANVTLSGLNSEIVALALSEYIQGRPARIMLGVEGAPDVVVAFSGLIDTMPLEDDGTSATITVRIESKLATLERPRMRRYTHESQQSLHPGDTFFSFVTDLQDKEITWGRKTNSGAAASGGSTSGYQGNGKENGR
ncbi:hypothetical protein ACGYK5_17185 [Sulfitobacter sp. 1A16787]|uniref:hypothetical protein n=1 Tax=Sulfitobacter sp. 1A16787 TaxID=3368571 RepID=UPI003746DEE8